MSRHYKSDSSTGTLDEIREICRECDTDSHTQRSFREECYQPRQRYDPGVSYFMSVITPVTGLTPQYSGCTGSVEFRMRRKNKTVTLQWEPFNGSLAANGVVYLTVAQSISNTPPYPVSIPITLQYKGINRTTSVTIDPHARTGNIKFYLTEDGLPTGAIGDTFYVFGGAVTWIVD